MKWYRRMYFKTFEWYRDMNGAQSWPESYAAAILGTFHALNLVALGWAIGLPTYSSSLPYHMTGWLLAGSLIGMVPPMWCAFRAKQIEAEFSSEDEVINPKGRAAVGIYGFISIATVIAAGVYRIAGSNGGHAG
jgi:hypothetical protein